MEFLEFLQGLRNPIMDGFFSLVTLMGEEVFFILVGLVFFWCIDKKQGYYLLLTGLISTVANQLLKLIFRIPRPWVLDPEFKIVESAKAAATGYSFPSGHTQSATVIFGTVFLRYKKLFLRIVVAALCLLVAFSRMWLGVHTPFDVCVGLLVSLALVLLIYPVVQKGTKTCMRSLFIAGILIDVALILYVFLYKFPADVDAENLAHGAESAFKMLGCLLGMWTAYEVDVNLSHFETKAPLWAQLVKLAVGIVPVILIKSLLKEPLYAIIPNEYVADGVRYFLLTAFAGALWPLTFRMFNKKEQK